MNINLKIAIAESSSIIRSGLEVQMKKLSGFRFQFIEIAEKDHLTNVISKYKPDILIINPEMVASNVLQQIKEEAANPILKCIALLSTLIDKNVLRVYDEQITIYDSTEELKQKFDQLCEEEEITEEKESDEQQVLSPREKEIVVFVVKGLTNRDIADRLFLSTHTVITHRRNIARKLQIHSPSGLTVYAIVNKLVELSDINQ